jgi:threonine dehydratase
MANLEPIPKEEILAARQRLQSWIPVSPLIPLNIDHHPGKIYLKLENLGLTGSFKLRGAGNALLAAPKEDLANGVWTASAGNMALGLAWFARQLSISCTVIVPDDTPPIKLSNIQKLGAEVIQVPFQQYQQIQRRHRFNGISGKLIHPFADEKVIAGNATIGLEILETIPDVDVVFAPYGGGGLCCGIASAMREWKPETRVLACEVETGAPLAASLRAGHPIEVSFSPSFISGIGAPFIFPKIWELASQLLSGSIVVSISQAADAVRKLAIHQHVIAEGAGAVALAAALHRDHENIKVVCIVSGGNIDAEKFATILKGYVPK